MLGELTVSVVFGNSVFDRHADGPFRERVHLGAASHRAAAPVGLPLDALRFFVSSGQAAAFLSGPQHASSPFGPPAEPSGARQPAQEVIPAEGRCFCSIPCSLEEEGSLKLEEEAPRLHFSSLISNRIPRPRLESTSSTGCQGARLRPNPCSEGLRDLAGAFVVTSVTASHALTGHTVDEERLLGTSRRGTLPGRAWSARVGVGAEAGTSEVTYGRGQRMPSRNTTALIVVASAITSSFGFAEDRPAKVEVLLLSGMNNHDWTRTTPALEKSLEETGAFRGDGAREALEPDPVPARGLRRGREQLQHVHPPPCTGKGLRLVACDEEEPARFRARRKRARGRPRRLGRRSTTGQSTARWSWAGSGRGRPATAIVTSSGSRWQRSTHPIARGLSDFRTFDELWHRTEFREDVTIVATAHSSKESGGQRQGRARRCVRSVRQGT